MIEEINEKIKQIIKEKIDLNHKEDSISSNDFNKQMEELEEKYKELNTEKIRLMNQTLLKELQPKTNEQLIQEVIKEEKKVSRKKTKEKPKKIEVPKVKITNEKNVESYTSLLIKALLHPLIDSEEKVLKIVLDWKPGMKEERLREHLRKLINGIKNNKLKKYKKYKWIKEKYKLGEKCQTTIF